MEYKEELKKFLVRFNKEYDSSVSFETIRPKVEIKAKDLARLSKGFRFLFS